jgi:hypothetical protein
MPAEPGGHRVGLQEGKRQLACKPGSVWPRRPEAPRRGGHSSWTHVAMRLTQPTRMAGLETALRVAPHAIPIRSCSRWGFPCRSCCQSRGGLLPHPFTLAANRPVRRPASRRFAFCGTFPGVAPAGRYPAPCLHGARTFLTCRLSALAGAAARPAGPAYKGVRGRKCNRERPPVVNLPGDLAERAQPPARWIFTFEQYAAETGFMRRAA